MASSGSHKDSKGAFDPECMDNCTSKQHGGEICALGTGIKTQAVVPMWMKTCANYAHVRDEEGRTALHIVASTGNDEALGWLIKRGGCDIDKKDKISGYTALHRSVFFGQIHVARSLISYNADLNLKDHEGMTALEMCHADRPRPFSFNCSSDPSELFVWGTNDNYTLGTAIQQTRPVPEQLEIFKKNSISIQQVAMSTYHSVFLAQTGEVYTCGSGRGGKLGLNHESSVLKPEMIQFSSNCKCVKVSAGVDHTLFLLENGKVLSCGSNEHGVLGQKSSVVSSLVPKPVELPKSTSVKGFIAARYHSVFYTSKCLYTCGSNRGQMGHSSDLGGIIYEPKVVSQHILDASGDLKFTHVSCNDFVTAARVSSGVVYLLHKFESQKINTKQFDVEKLEVMGGSWGDLVACDKPRPKEEGGTDCPVTVFILTTTGRIVIWRESGTAGGCFSRVVFNTGRNVLDITDFCLSSTCIGFVTRSGEAYRCSWKPNLTPIAILSIQQRSQVNSQPNQNDFQISSGSRRQQKSKDYGNFAVGLEHLKTSRIKNIYSAGSITCDPRGNNFAIIQAIPKQDLTQLPEILESEINNDMRKFLEQSHVEDSLHDVVFKIGGSKFPSHRYIIASGCPKLHGLILDAEKTSGQEKPITVSIENLKPKIFQQLLQFIYSNSCDLISPGKFFSESEDFIRQSIDSARKLDLEILCKELKKVEIVDDLVRMKRGETLRRPTAKRFSRKGFPELFDVTLKNQTGETLRAHRCILIARMEYFHSMLYANSWMEQDQDKPVYLQLQKGALSTLLDFTYSDDAPNLPIGDFDGLSDILVMSDTFFIERLRTITENALADKLCFKNVASLLYLAFMCNATQLQESCMQFISLNLPCILENRILDPLPNEILKSLSAYYCEIHPTMFKRAMKRVDGIPMDRQFLEEFEEIPEELKGEFFQCLQDEEIRKPQGKTSKSRLRMRSRASESEIDVTPKSPSLLNLNTSLDTSCELLDDEEFRSIQFYPEPKPDVVSYSSSPPTNKPRFKINIPNPSQTMKNLKNAEIKEQTPVKKILNPLEFPTLDTNPSIVKASDSKINSEEKLSSSAKPKVSKMEVNGKIKVTGPAETTPKISSTCGGSAKKKVKWKAVNVENIASISTKETVSPTSVANLDVTPSRDPSNPWKIKSTEKVVFTEIVQDEVEKKENLAKAVTKSINLMQIEERAMNELTALYTSHDVQEGIEILTVERIFSNNFANPTWVQHQHAAAVSQSNWPKFTQ